MKIKTSELIGPALDWAVAKCEGIKNKFLQDLDLWGDNPYTYSTDWAQGGPIIEREGIDIIHANDSEWVWRATLFLQVPCAYNTPQEVLRIGGNTPLIAAMRCYVASRLGDTIDIPTALQD